MFFFNKICKSRKIITGAFFSYLFSRGIILFGKNSGYFFLGLLSVFFLYSFFFRFLCFLINPLCLLRQFLDCSRSVFSIAALANFCGQLQETYAAPLCFEREKIRIIIQWMYYRYKKSDMPCGFHCSKL